MARSVVSALSVLSVFSALSVISGPANMPRHQQVHRVEDLLERRGEVALLVDVAQELLGQQQLAWASGSSIWSCSRRWSIRSRDSTVTGSVYSSCSYCSRVPPTSKPLSRISSQSTSSCLLLLLLLLFGGGLFRRLLFGLQQLEEGIGQQLLLEVLLQVHHGHVQHVHGLVQPRD